jgi:hypothetical protein
MYQNLSSSLLDKFHGDIRDIHKPIGVSEFRFNELPDNIKSLMPTVTELENELFGFNNMRSVGEDC